MDQSDWQRGVNEWLDGIVGEGKREISEEMRSRRKNTKRMEKKLSSPKIIFFIYKHLQNSETNPSRFLKKRETRRRWKEKRRRAE
jgi:hypothetical protein